MLCLAFDEIKALRLLGKVIRKGEMGFLYALHPISF